MQSRHKIAYRPSCKSYSEQERKRGQCVRNNKWEHSIMPIQSLPMKNLPRLRKFFVHLPTNRCRQRVTLTHLHVLYKRWEATNWHESNKTGNKWSACTSGLEIKWVLTFKKASNISTRVSMWYTSKGPYQYRAIRRPNLIVKASNTYGNNYVYYESKPVITNISAHVNEWTHCQHLWLHPKAC